MAELEADGFQAARLILTLRQRGITSSPVLKAIETIDRAAFVEPALAEMAFEDVHIPIGCGQTLLPPVQLAQLLSAAGFSDVAQGRTLVIGAGSGFSAALCAQLSETVVAIERYLSLAEAAFERLAELGFGNASILHGDGLAGWKGAGRFDRIVLMGSVAQVPQALLDALAPEGRLVAPVGMGGQVRLVTATRDHRIDGPEFDSAIVALRPGTGAFL